MKTPPKRRSRRERLSEFSHQLRTPLTAIKGYAQTLRRGAVDDPRLRREFAATIERHADRLTRLLDKFLSAPERGRR